MVDIVRNIFLAAIAGLLLLIAVAQATQAVTFQEMWVAQQKWLYNDAVVDEYGDEMLSVQEWPKPKSANRAPHWCMEFYQNPEVQQLCLSLDTHKSEFAAHVSHFWGHVNGEKTDLQPRRGH